MKKNLAKRISAGILATFLGMEIGYCNSAWADEIKYNYIKDDAYYGAYKGDALENIIITNGNVVVNNGDTYSAVYGGYSKEGRNNTIIRNEVTINSGSLIENGSMQNSGVVAGGYTEMQNCEVSYNTVNINGGDINGTVYGALFGYGGGGENNNVIIRGGSINGDIHAAYSKGKYSKTINNNIKIIGNAENMPLINGGLYGSRAAKLVEMENVCLDINDWNNNGIVSQISNFTDVNIYNSSLTINWINNEIGNINIRDNSDVTVKNIDLYYFDEEYNDRCGNVTIENSRFAVNDTMTYVDSLHIINSTLTAGELEDCWNINIKNSDVKIDNISYFDEINIENENTKSVVLGNISGNEYYGSRIITDSKIKAESIENLKSLDVDMTSIAWEKDGTVIDVAGKADFTGTTVSVNGKLTAAAGTEISNGDSMSFIKAGELTGIKAADIDDSKLYIGFAQEADVTLTDNGNSIDFVVSGMPQASDQTTIIGDSRTAAIAFANQGSDVLNEVLSSIEDEEYGIKTFALVHGNRSKYDVASDIKINGWSVLTGVGETKKVNDDLLSWGVFYENGSGNYRTYNNFNGNDLTGFGSSVYNGGGAMLRYDNNSGTYIQAGVRAGNLKNSLGNAVADGFGTVGGYSIDSFYYVTLLGVGKIIQLNETDNIDVYGKYFYTHHDGESVNILGDDVNFDSAESNRIRLGARYNKTLSEKLSGYYGLAWDYEFSGDADTYIAGFDVDNESLKGSTAVIEAGLHYAPDNSPWSIDLGLQGYAGQCEGFSGNVQATYTF